MNIEKINSNFIEKIKNTTSSSATSDTLAEILPLSKEAIYRRLRGEVLFSYSEAVLISRKLRISLDEINYNDNNVFAFKINKPSNELAEEAYSELLSFAINHLSQNKETPHLFFTSATIPASLIGNYPYLSKFRFYKWVYENRGLEIPKKMSEISISESLSNTSSSFLDTMRRVDSTLILSDTMFEYYLKEIVHFVALGLIDQSEIELIKADLHNLTDEFEVIAASGKHVNGAKVSVYLTDINIESTFGYLIHGQSVHAFSKMFAMNYAISDNIQVFEMYKKAFEDLKDYATLISQCGSARRKSFFNKQHLIINESL